MSTKGNRKKAEQMVYTIMEELLPGGGMTEIYANRFKEMSDEEFDQFIQRLESGQERLAVIAPNFGKVRLEIERNLNLAEKWGHSFFERIWIEGDDETPPYLSNDKYLVIDLPLRRQAQLLTKKISTPEDANTVNDLSGQPTGKSHGSSISYPESQILRALGLFTNQEELIKWRGGDEKGFKAMNTSISRTGGVSIQDLAKLGTEVTSTRTLSTLLTSMHIANTLSS